MHKILERNSNITLNVSGVNVHYSVRINILTEIKRWSCQQQTGQEKKIRKFLKMLYH